MTQFIDGTRFDTGSFAPIAVATRSGLDESLHFGAGVVRDGRGAVEASVGDGDTIVYPRSSLKPLQADAMVAAGLDIPADLLALACATHSGEAMHLGAARRTLEMVGLTEADLQNTPARPSGATARDEARRAGIDPSALQQNCSGKHAAMLVTCKLNDWPIEHYMAVEHPLQRSITKHITQLIGAAITEIGIDGCGAPTHAFALRGLTDAFAAVALADGPVARAMRAHPELVGGTGRDVTIWMQAVPGLIAKEGAAGVLAAALPDGRAVAYKIADGSDVARQAVMPKAMNLLGVDRETIGRVVAETRVPVMGHGHEVGQLRPLRWLAPD
jgi:L-asparaginase II